MRRLLAGSTSGSEGSALVEFAIALPLLVVFVVGIYDFGGAFNEKQKIEQAAQEGAIVAGAQPMSDIYNGNADPASLHAVVNAVFNSLQGSNVLSGGTLCNAPGVAAPNAGVSWTYTISGCPDTLIVTINRGVINANCNQASANGQPIACVGTSVTVQYPYQWRFNSVIQVLLPGAQYAATTTLSETATVHNQT